MLPVAALFVAPCPVKAQARRVDVAAGSLASAIIALARQTGTTIVTSDAAAPGVRVRGVHGLLTVDAALRAMLAGTNFEGARLNATTFVVRRRPPSPRPPVLPPRRPPPPPDTGPDIVVTATKIDQPLSTFNGTAHVLSLDAPGLRGAEGRGSAAIVDQLPIMASTGLGPGRDKLFVRGIADSSFSGATQAAVGQYLGEVRLNYNAPDPSLALYDLSGIEVLEGPQSTLYGAGSLGGILRLVPRRPVAGRWEGSVTSAVSLAANGRSGTDLAGVLNVPLGARSAARIVAYRNTVPGAVDDVGRGLRAVGDYRTTGARAMVVLPVGDGWSIDLTGAHQVIDHSDARYAEGPRDPPSRSSAIAQPAGIRFSLAAVTLRKRWNSGLELVSTSSMVSNDARVRYDLSKIVAGVSSDSRDRARVISHETRLSRTRRRGGWVLGLHAMSSSDLLATTLTGADVETRSSEVGTGVVDAALFGEATVPLSRTWTATVGGRISYSEVRVSGKLPSAVDPSRLSTLDGGTTRVLPSAALGWHPVAGASAYLRYQRGYRVGGLTIHPLSDPSGTLPDYMENVFRPDSLDMVELGVRFGRARNSPLTGMIALSATRWKRIQADLFDSFGPFTGNVGDGRILGIETSVGWRVTPSLTLSAAAFVADTTLYRDGTASRPSNRQWLPNIPLATARLDAEWRSRIGDADLTLRGRTRYVGLSRLGVGENLSIRQGDYLEVGTGAEIVIDGRSLFLDVDNLFDVRGNRFALGNPFTAMSGDQRTPLQPRTVRVGARFTF